MAAIALNMYLSAKVPGPIDVRQVGSSSETNQLEHVGAGLLRYEKDSGTWKYHNGQEWKVLIESPSQLDTDLIGTASPTVAATAQAVKTYVQYEASRVLNEVASSYLTTTTGDARYRPISWTPAPPNLSAYLTTTAADERYRPISWTPAPPNLSAYLTTTAADERYSSLASVAEKASVAQLINSAADLYATIESTKEELKTDISDLNDDVTERFAMLGASGESPDLSAYLTTTAADARYASLASMADINTAVAAKASIDQLFDAAADLYATIESTKQELKTDISDLNEGHVMQAYSTELLPPFNWTGQIHNHPPTQAHCSYKVTFNPPRDTNRYAVTLQVETNHMTDTLNRPFMPHVILCSRQKEGFEFLVQEDATYINKSMDNYGYDLDVTTASPDVFVLPHANDIVTSVDLKTKPAVSNVTLQKLYNSQSTLKDKFKCVHFSVVTNGLIVCAGMVRSDGSRISVDDQ